MDCWRPWPAVLVSWMGQNKRAPGCFLRQQKLILSQFWRIEVQGQCVSELGFSRGLSLRLADSRLLSCPHMAFPLCVDFALHVQMSSSYKDPSPIGLQTTFMTSSSLNHPFKGPTSKYGHIVRHWLVRTSTHTVEGTPFRP